MHVLLAAFLGVEPRRAGPNRENPAGNPPLHAPIADHEAAELALSGQFAVGERPLHDDLGAPGIIDFAALKEKHQALKAG